jgi:hypothetical protein
MNVSKRNLVSRYNHISDKFYETYGVIYIKDSFHILTAAVAHQKVQRVQKNEVKK